MTKLPSSTSRFIRADAAARKRATRALLLASSCIAASSALAHGFGQRYDLPLPLSLYLIGTAAAIAFSFVVVGLFVRSTPRIRAYPSVSVLERPLARLLAWHAAAPALKLLGVVLFAVTLIAGFRGNQDPYRNIAPTLVWIIGWVGLAYACAFVGNVWILLNPWRTLFMWAEYLYRRARRDGELSRHLVYPDALGAWPAFVLLLAFSWTELVYRSPALPLHIAWLTVGYSILTWTGMLVFGCEIWLRNGEAFSVFFALLARFAPVALRDASDKRRELVLRPWAAGLLDSAEATTSMAAFVLLVLSCVLYDGVLATPQWNAIEAGIAAQAPFLGERAALAIRTGGLIVSWLLFSGAYAAVSAFMSVLVRRRRSTWAIARTFAFTLVPIAIAYHLAHYLTYLLIQGQYIVPLLSDPFGYGWDLFGTAGYRVDIGVVGARFEWYAAVSAIVVGHIIAVYLAHRQAMQAFAARATVLQSQVPLTALMVAYTFVSLSILAEPITERSVSAQRGDTSVGVRIPEDAVLPVPGDGRLQPVGVGKLARQKLTYRVLGSAFHDGTSTGAADILYAYMFAYRWGVLSPAEPQHYDAYVDAATAPLRERLAGLKFVGTDTASKSFRVGDVNVVRELLAFDVYTTIASQDPERDALIPPPWSALPWHVLVLMEEAVIRGWAAFSERDAAKRGVAWLDLVRSEPLKAKLVSLAENFAREGYRPDALRSLVSSDEARKRWNALVAFYRARGHFLVTNGPYQLKRWTETGVGLDVFRDLSYPLGVGSYDAYAIPRRGFITKGEQTAGRVRLFGEIETIMKFQRSYELVRRPLDTVERTDLQRAAPECRYTVMDASGRVLLAGSSQPADDGSFEVDLKSELPPGSYTMLAEITVDRNAANAEIRRIPLLVPEKP